MRVICILAVFLLGFAIGMLLYSVPHQSGTLHIEVLDGEPYLFLELDEGVDVISKKSNIMVRIKAPRE